ncbi:hypothetical protein FS749_014506 [Ceratobasidium sp. UAMH 11750]|nr:hypothetical protein FS749_014506 [Ceratobasidium sp. UAMH 11750]
MAKAHASSNEVRIFVQDLNRPMFSCAEHDVGGSASSNFGSFPSGDDPVNTAQASCGDGVSRPPDLYNKPQSVVPVPNYPPQAPDHGHADEQASTRSDLDLYALANGYDWFNASLISGLILFNVDAAERVAAESALQSALGVFDIPIPTQPHQNGIGVTLSQGQSKPTPAQ